MSKFDKHFKMNENDAIEFIKAKLNFFDKNANLVAKEVGDGNINYVFIVKDLNSNKSIAIKHADKLLRTSQRELDVNRNRIEFEVLKHQYKYAPEFIPQIHYYDPIMCIIVMDDISNYKNMRNELMNQKIFPDFTDNITTFIVNTILPTTDLVMNSFDKKDNQINFINKDMCKISEDLVFTEPYINYKGRNIILDENLEYVKKEIYSDKKLICQVGILKNGFMNNSQALIHGDLHTGSIFINKKGIKILDPEFAFYGPIGYDLGNLIGNLIFSWIFSKITIKNEYFEKWIEDTIGDIIKIFKVKFIEKYDQIVTDVIAKTPEFKIWYLNQILIETAGYAGTEIIRRTVGDSKVSEITMISDTKIRINQERILIQIGKKLILERIIFTDFNKYKQLLENEIQEK